MLSSLANGLVALVALAHVWFLVLEMFLWQTPPVRRRFQMSEELARDSAVLAKNQGLYNGFLAAGLFWSLFAPAAYAVPLKFFFLGCVIVAGIYGGFTAHRMIWGLQALPGLLALIAVFLTL